MVNPLWFVVGGIAVAELYKRYATPEQKTTWENFVQIHHGEAVAVMAGVGLLSKSPRLTASGIGLIAHDWKDKDKWFTGDKNKVNY